MSVDEIYTKLVEIWLYEEVRLLDKVAELERYCLYNITDDRALLELIQARARLKYFKGYLSDVLNFLKYFDR